MQDRNLFYYGVFYSALSLENKFTGMSGNSCGKADVYSLDVAVTEIKIDDVRFFVGYHLIFIHFDVYLN